VNERDRSDETLARLLRAAQAEPDGALWTRVRTRLAAGDPVPAVVAWLMRPAALAVSVATFALASVLSLQLLGDITPPTSSTATGLTDALIGVEKTPVEGFVTGTDLGAETPADSDIAR